MDFKLGILPLFPDWMYGELGGHPIHTLWSHKYCKISPNPLPGLRVTSFFCVNQEHYNQQKTDRCVTWVASELTLLNKQSLWKCFGYKHKCMYIYIHVCTCKHYTVSQHSKNGQLLHLCMSWIVTVSLLSEEYPFDLQITEVNFSYFW